MFTPPTEPDWQIHDDFPQGTRISVNRISNWEDFNPINIDKLFGDILDEDVSESRLPSLPELPDAQLRVGNEDDFESVVIADTARILNTALVVGAEVWSAKHQHSPPIQPVLMLRGGYSREVIEHKPDWSGVRVQVTEDQSKENSLVCGDSKYADYAVRIVWKPRDNVPDEKKTGDLTLMRSWLDQANMYAAEHGTRFFYILTPKSAFVCWRYMDEPSTILRTPIAQNQRQDRSRTAAPVNYQESPSSQEPQTPKAKSQSNEDSSFEGTPASKVSKDAEIGINLANVYWPTKEEGEYVRNQQKLSVNLALWTIHMLAAIGEVFGGLRVKYKGNCEKKDTP
ncbi:hypothetical protein BKA65DRAFT_560071 [Rhexocercosporidium sp. MPI-PUGE-AT-0058]|nr:hypothetical protein BKA65DRAFT_560071 [Rhexocercosporidium sp. MPI-PUGE-AT-0058]